MITPQKKIEIQIEALRNLNPSAPWKIEGPFVWEEEKDPEGNLTGKIILTNLDWYDKTIPYPNKEDWEAEVVRLEQQWIDTEYQRKRKPEYPPLADLADALYWQSQGDESKMTAYMAVVEAVKQKYPKGNV